MTQTKAKTAGWIGTMMVVVAVTMVLMARKPARTPGNKATPERIAATVDRIQQASAGLPDSQIQAKTLIMTAMLQKRIPDAANWCDTLNTGNRLWPALPTNTVFALNSRMAGHPYVRGIRGDTVVFFEAANSGWNQAGGPERLAEKTQGVAVAFADGRALIVPSSEVARLRWEP